MAMRKQDEEAVFTNAAGVSTLATLVCLCA